MLWKPNQLLNVNKIWLALEIIKILSEIIQR